MLIDLERHRREFATAGWTLVSDILPTDTVCSWIAKIQSQTSQARAIQRASMGTQSPDNAMVYRHYLTLNGHQIRELIPDMHIWYQSLIPLWSAITFWDVITSPHVLSDCNVKIYQGEKAGHGWHYDTNGLTVLLYLSDNSTGGTRLQPLDNAHPQQEADTRTVVVLPRKGHFLVMRGRKVYHCGESCENEVKIACPWNYYIAGDVWRPNSLDLVSY